MSATSSRRIYLDQAATSWPKSPRAIQAAFDFLRDCGATAGRGAYQSSGVAERWLDDARANLARLIGASNGQSIAMCSSGTHALNVALHGLLRPGDHVLTTAIEHNSVLRPLAALKESQAIEVSHVGSDRAGIAQVDQAAELVRPNTRLIVVGHASNVTGAVQDLEAWSALARHTQTLLLVDASQTLGYRPIDVRASGVDLLAAAGHKGLRALPGTGFLYVRGELQPLLRPLMSGGTGRASGLLDGGQEWPSSVEVGNLNMPGVVSMAVAAAELASDGPAYASWQPPFQRLVAGLGEVQGIDLLGYPQLAQAPHVPLLSLLASAWDVHDLSSVLDTSFGIEARAGWHCAALVHEPLGSATSGGTLRLSTGHTTSLEEIDITISAFREICAS